MNELLATPTKPKLQTILSQQGGNHDIRCVMEARLESHQPIAVTDEAENIDEAIDGAVEKLKRSLDHTIGRLSNRSGRKP